MYVNPNKRKDASNVRWVLQYCKPDMWKVWLAIFLFIINDTMAMTMPLLSGFIVDKIIIGKQHKRMRFNGCDDDCSRWLKVYLPAFNGKVWSKCRVSPGERRVRKASFSRFYVL